MKAYNGFILLFVLHLFGCNSSNLGDSFFLLEGDRREDKIIVFCTGKSLECYSGIPVVPTYHRQFKNGKYAEYVEHAKSDSDWIIVQTTLVENGQKNYWIVNKKFKIDVENCELTNCESIIKSNVYGPFSYHKFIEQLRHLEVTLHFKT